MGLAIIIPGVDFSTANLGKVTLSENFPVTGISIIGDSSVIGTSDATTYTVEYTPAVTDQIGVTWSIDSGSEYASISSSGVLSVLSGADGDSVTIKAVSNYDSSVLATKTIVVTYGSRLNYIQTGNGNYVDTGVSQKADATYELDVEIINSANSICFGARKAYGEEHLDFCGSLGESYISPRRIRKNATTLKKYSFALGRYKAIYGTSTGSLYINDVLAQDSFPCYPVTSSIPFYLFSMNNNGTPLPDQSPARIYRFVERIGDEVTHDFVPCLVDNTPKFIDLVTNTSYPITGESEILYG